jgi:hypothetical protein
MELKRKHQPSIEDRIATYVLTADKFGDCLVHRGPLIMWVGPRRRERIDRLVFEIVGGYPLKSSEQLIPTCCCGMEAGCSSRSSCLHGKLMHCLNIEHMKVL